MGIRRNPAPPEIGVVDLDTAKRIKRGELRDMRDAVIKEGFSYGGRTYPIDPDIQLSMMIQFQTSQVMPAPSYSWKDVDGIYREIGDADAFRAFVTAALLYGQSQYAREEMLQGLVESKTTVEDVLAVTWMTVPPGG